MRQQPDRLFAMRQGFHRKMAFQEHLAQVRTRQCIARVELDRAAEMHECLIHPAALAQHVAQVAVGRRKAGPQFDRLTKLLGGLPAPAHRLQRQPEIRDRLGIVGLETQGRATASGSPLKLAERSISLGEVRVKRSSVGPQSHRPRHQLDRASVCPLLVMQHAEQVHCFGILGFTCQDLLI